MLVVVAPPLWVLPLPLGALSLSGLGRGRGWGLGIAKGVGSFGWFWRGGYRAILLAQGLLQDVSGGYRVMVCVAFVGGLLLCGVGCL